LSGYMHPQTEESVLLRCFRDYTVEAMTTQPDTVRQKIQAHLHNDAVKMERLGWSREIIFKQDDDDEISQFVCSCILNRDFREISEYVEMKMNFTQGGGGVSGGGASGGGVSGGGASGGGASGGGSRRLNAGETDQRNVQMQADTIVTNLPEYMAIQKKAWWKWDKKTESFKSALWTRFIEQLNAEAHLVFCGEIIKHRYDASYTASVFCELHDDSLGDKAYSVDEVLTWYGSMHHKPWDIQMICDIHNFKSSSEVNDYCYVMPFKYDPKEELTIEKMRVVVTYCAILVQNVDSARLPSIMKFDLAELCSIGAIYNNIYNESAHVQQLEIFRTQAETQNCLYIYNSCTELEKQARMYVFLNHFQSHHHTRALMSHLVKQGIFSMSENIWKTFQTWVIQGALGKQGCLLSAAIIEWGGESFALFCSTSQMHNMYVHNESTDMLEDASHLLDPAIFEEIFEANLLQDNLQYQEA